MSTFERPCVDGLLIAQLRTIVEQLSAGRDLPDQIEARRRLERLLEVFGQGASRLRLVLSPKVKSRPSTARCYAAGEDLPPDGPEAA